MKMLALLCHRSAVRIPSAVLASRRLSAGKARRTVRIFCGSCSQLLYVYEKRNGTQTRLVKVILERIVQDEVGDRAAAVPTSTVTEREVHCPSCRRAFARGPVRLGKWICNKIIQGRVSVTN